MDLSIQQGDLAFAVARALGSVPQKSAQPLLNCLLLEADRTSLRVTGSDLDLTTSVSVPCLGKAPGRAAVNARHFHEVVRKMPRGAVSLRIEKNQLEVSYGDGKGWSRFPALEVGGWKLKAEVAVSPQARATGLMRRDTLPENQGMLFVNPRGHRPCMWMKETSIPLAVAFIDANGVILNLAEMQAHSLDLHCAAGESGYVLEMNAGWFGRRGIGPGARLFGLNTIRR